MPGSWTKLKGYLAGLMALVACPCHLPITLPILITLTAGTAVSAWLASNFWVVAGISTVVFLGSGLLAFMWLGQDQATTPARAHRGPLRVTLLTSRGCTSCAEARAVWSEVKEQNDFRFQVVDISSPHGRELASRHNIFTTPATLINGQVAFRGVPKPDHAAEAVWK